MTSKAEQGKPRPFYLGFPLGLKKKPGEEVEAIIEAYKNRFKKKRVK